MKLCKKALALLLVLVMALSAVPGVLAAEDTAAPSAQEKELAVQVLNAYAEAMFLRGQRVQYDDSQMVPAAQVHDYRWQRQTRVAESYTSQFPGYTNCAAFAHDVYYFALGMDIQHYTTANLIKADEKIRPFYYKPTGKETAEEKAAMKEQFLSTIQPGDILVYRSTVDTGHALYYVGNGRIIHSSTPPGGYSYNDKLEKREPDGSIMEMDVSRFFEEDYSRHFFSYASQIALVRPLNIWEGTVPQMSIDRMNNLAGVMAEKLSSHTAGQTVQPGEEVTYTIRMENRNETPVTLKVTDELPSHTTLVGEGKLAWEVSVEGGKTAEVTYTVKVDADAPVGAALEGDRAVINGVTFPCPNVYVGKHLTAEQKAAVTKAAQTARDKTGMALAKAVYGDTGVSLDAMDDVAVLMDSALIPSEKVSDHFQINENSPYFAALAPTLYGGTMVEGSDCYAGVRTRGLSFDHLEVGDIVIASYAPFTQEYVMYLVAGEDSVLRLDQPQLLTGEDAVKALDTAISYHKFLVVRPAGLPDKQAVAGLTASAASAVPDVAELTGKGETVTLYANDFDSYPVGEDALWQTILAGDEFATNVTEKDDTTVRYDIVEEEGNRALQLFSAKKKTPWMKVNRELVGNYTVQLDFKLSNEPKFNQWLYLTLYQDSKTHAFVHLHSDGVRFQYKPLPTDQTSTAMNVPPYMFYPEHSTPDVWHTIKIARVDGGLYLKVWDKGQSEPANWMLSLRNDVLDASQPSHFRMQYYVTQIYSSTKNADVKATMLVDNLTVTRQVELPAQPAEEATRGEMMRTLWSAMGSPKPVGKENPFTDVKEGDAWYEAVLWAYANGITAGTSASTFSPQAPVLRGQAVTFLYRAAKAAATGANGYTDVPAGAYYAQAAVWAGEQGVLAGKAADTFAPAEGLTLGQLSDAVRKAFTH